MLTIFTVPKPFAGHSGRIQRNAIRSWLALRPACQVILLGAEGGVADCAADLGLDHIPDVPCTEHGTPLLHAVFARAEHAARFPLLCYVNADVILPQAFTACVRRITLPRFVMVGRRLNVEVDEELDFSDGQRRRELEDLLRRRGKVHTPGGIDYFVFPRGTLGSLPPFAVGRPVWDNWMVYRARELRVPLVDASGCVLVFHQSHGYGHVPDRSGHKWEGPEADANRALISPGVGRFTSKYATWELDGRGLRRRPWWRRPRSALLHELAVFHPSRRSLLPAADIALRLRDRLSRSVAGHARRARPTRSGGDPPSSSGGPPARRL